MTEKSEPDILPQILGTNSNSIGNSHPAAEWNMVSTNPDHDYPSSSSSSSTLQIILKAVDQHTKNMNKKVDTQFHLRAFSVSRDKYSLSANRVKTTIFTDFAMTQH